MIPESDCEVSDDNVSDIDDDDDYILLPVLMLNLK